MPFTFDAKQTATQMATAIVGSLKKDLPLVKEYAASEGKKLAETIAHVGELYVQKKIDQPTCELLLDMQRHASRAVLLTIEGLGVIAVENAINAALAIAKQAVNAGLGFALL